jgi:hypothetical protein
LAPGAGPPENNKPTRSISAMRYSSVEPASP